MSAWRFVQIAGSLVTPGRRVECIEAECLVDDADAEHLAEMVGRYAQFIAPSSPVEAAVFYQRLGAMCHARVKGIE